MNARRYMPSVVISMHTQKVVRKIYIYRSLTACNDFTRILNLPNHIASETEFVGALSFEAARGAPPVAILVGSEKTDMICIKMAVAVMLLPAA